MNNRQRSKTDRKPKPLLWAAVEKHDEASVQKMLAEGKDPEERFESWTPFMKAAEIGCVAVMRMLLDQNVDIEASNKKGRTALSFAAAPSMDGMTPRLTPVLALRFLLEHGADPNRKDQNGFTPKDHARKAKRGEAIAIFAEFSVS